MNKIPLELWDADAIVLFDWLMQVELQGVTSVPVTKAQKQALTDLLTQLEQSNVSSVTQAEIDSATLEVAENMGWS